MAIVGEHDRHEVAGDLLRVLLVLLPCLAVQASVQVVDDLVLRAQWLVLVEVLVQGEQMLLHDLLSNILLSHVLVDAFHLLPELFLIGLDAVQLLEELLVVEEDFIVLI